MPVQHFRTLEEWNAAHRQKSEGFDRFLRHNAFIRMLAKRSFPPGVHKYRTLEEAQRARELWLTLHNQESR